MATNSLILLITLLLAICFCQDIKADKRREIKLQKLTRMHNALQKEVDDIWETIITTGKDTQDNENTARTDVIGTDTQLTAVQELKTEVEHLILSLRLGFKNEKSLQREAIRNITILQDVFQTDLTERLDTKVARIDQSCNDFQAKMETETSEFNKRIKDARDEQGVFNERITKLLDNLSTKQNRLETENNELKRSFAEVKKDFQNFVAEHETLKQTILNVKNDNEKMKTELIMCISQTKTTTTITPPTLTTTTAAPPPTTLRKSCDGGWLSFNGHCYLSKDRYITWDDAVAFCESKNSYLVEITTDAELRFVSSHFRWFWLGATDRETSGTFVYQHSRLQVPLRFWDKGEPRYTGNKCVYIYLRNKKTYSSDCTYRHAVVCEKHEH